MKPSLAQLNARTGTEAEVRRERFITRQMEALRDLGIPADELKREEALLRGGMQTAEVISNLFMPAGSRL